MGIFSSIGKFFKGTPGKIHQVSNLRPEQEGLYQQLVGAGKKAGAGGAFGTAADYYRNLLSDNPADMQAFAAPEMRRYYEDIVPNISEQFAGMGSGGLSSSGFRNAQVQGSTDLSERLAQIRANLRQSAAQGLTGIGQAGLQNFQQTYQQPGTEGFLSSVSPAIGTAIGAGFGSSMGRPFGNSVGGNSSPYGQRGPRASPVMPQRTQMPSFMQGYGGF